MAVALRPRLLIADEPTTALDVTTQARILDLLKRLVREDGMGLLLITHDLAVVHGIADRLAVMQGGRIVETGPTRGVFAEMRHPYTRQLFAASAHRAELGPRVTHGPAARGARRGARLPPAPPAPLRQARQPPRGEGRRPRHPPWRARRARRRIGLRKSTLTRALLGLEPPTAGTITLGGAPIRAGAKDRHLRRRMQAVFQDPYGSFDPRHSVGRLVAEPLHLADDIPDREATGRGGAGSGRPSPDDAAKSIHAFSGGQRQRIAIARALVTRPDLVVFDEAVSALDVRVRAGILDLIARLSREEGLAYLFISHDLSVVRGICDRVMVMKAGEIVEDRAAEDLFAAPEHPYTRELLAAAPVLPEREREAS